ncbi:MAG: DUF177 domain-containing protein [Clostridiales bacterium]|nr:DUF177 domain-containing protein [Clostridiales bacterium]
MMIIDIRKLKVQKCYSGEMEFSYSAPEDLIEIPFVKFSSPVSVRFSFELYEDDALEINGTVSYTLEGECSRCLKETSTTVEGELNALFEPKKVGEDYVYSGGIVDLKKAVDEAIMASMPYTLSCGDDCKSIDYNSEPINK